MRLSPNIQLTKEELDSMADAVIIGQKNSTTEMSGEWRKYMTDIQLSWSRRTKQGNSRSDLSSVLTGEKPMKALSKELCKTLELPEYDYTISLFGVDEVTGKDRNVLTWVRKEKTMVVSDKAWEAYRRNGGFNTRDALTKTMARLGVCLIAPEEAEPMQQVTVNMDERNAELVNENFQLRQRVGELKAKLAGTSYSTSSLRENMLQQKIDALRAEIETLKNPPRTRKFHWTPNLG